MERKKQKLSLLCIALLLFCSGGVAFGDWDEGDPHKMHYPQLPKDGGWDIALFSSSSGSIWLADDWQCSQTGPVSDIHFWVSWKDDDVQSINGFSVRIWSDDPCGPNGYSEPNELISEKEVYAGDFTIRYMPDDWQGWFDPYGGEWDPCDHTQWAQINITDINFTVINGINEPFIQEEGKVYWLMIDMWGGGEIGWKQSGSPHFRDDAVYFQYNGSYWVELRDPETGESLDLAFVITTEEEEPNIKWEQLPDPYFCGLHAHDYDLGTGYERLILADDWLCEGGVVTDFHWWGAIELLNSGLMGFHLSIHANDPCCLPDDPALWEADVPIGSITAAPTGVFNSCGEEIIKYEYFLPPTDYFYQEIGNTYWFNVCALSNDPCNPCLWHWQEAGRNPVPILCPAANKIWPVPDTWSSISWDPNYSDMAFAITSGEPCEPEPGKPLQPHTKWSQPPIEVDPNSPIPTYCGWDEQSFVENTAAMFPCWDIPRQCHGDADGLWQGNTKTGYWYVGSDDLDILTTAWGGVYPNPPYDDCADFDRNLVIDNNDLDILYVWYEVYEPPWGSGVPPDCPLEGDSEIRHIVADDFRCIGSMPVTSIHWWGSFLDWEWSWAQGTLPPVLPEKWWIGFWSNVPANAPPYYRPYSYPDVLLHSITIDANRVTFEEVGSDEYYGYYPYDICYQYNVDLEPNEVFWQDDFNDITSDDIYWISIVAEYNDVCEPPQYPWGWKSRPWSWEDDAVKFLLPFKPDEGFHPDPCQINPIIDLVLDESFDMAFELDTDPNYIKWEQLYTGIRHWLHYKDEMSMGTVNRWTEVVTKWIQDPALGGKTGGIDVDATMELIPPLWPSQILADDFPCTTTGPITDISIWGSWLYDEMPMGDPTLVEFTLSIYSDNPMGPSGWSEPNQLLWRMDFPAGAFMVEKAYDGPEGYYSPCVPWYEPQNHFLAWKYSFHIDETQAFVQEGDPCEPVIYWLAVQARPIPEGTFRFGWKTSIIQWNDDAVWAIGEYDPCQPWQELLHPETSSVSLDLAFEITSSQEREELVIKRLVADDWRCEKRTPVTALAWWGSYIGYGYEACSQGPFMDLPVPPDRFRLSIWTDVPAGEATVAAGSSNGFVYVYDKAGNLLWSYDTGADVASVDVSVDGRYIAVGSYQNKLYLFDRSGTLLWQKDALIEYSYGGGWMGEESKSVSMSAYGEYVVAACSDNLFVYNNDGTLHWSDPNKETCADISPDGNYIAACDESSGALRFYSITSSSPLWTQAGNAYWVATSNPGYVAMSDGSSIYLYDNAGTQIWSYSTKSGYIRVDMPEDGLSVVAVNDDPSDSQGCELYYLNHLKDGASGWNAADGTPVWTFDPGGNMSDFYSVAISGDGEYIATGPAGGSYVFSKDSNAPEQTLSMGGANAYDLTYNGQCGACGNREGKLYYFSKDSSTALWNQTLGGIVHTVAVGLTDNSFSHPNEVIWEYETADYDEVLVGYDKYPHGEPNEPVFRYSVRLPEVDWFKQPDVNGIFWLSVMAIYDMNVPNYDWGWTNHKHMFNDNAVEGGYVWEPEEWWEWRPLYDQTGVSEDMSFMLFTDPNECINCADYDSDSIVDTKDLEVFVYNWLWTGPPGGFNDGDLNCDGRVTFADYAIFAQQWLDSCP